MKMDLHMFNVGEQSKNVQNVLQQNPERASDLSLGNRASVVTQDSVTLHCEGSSAEYIYIVIGTKYSIICMV